MTLERGPDDYLRAANGNFRIACLSYSSLQIVADELTERYELVKLASNPHAICSFLLVYAQCLMLTGSYIRALDIARETAEAADRYGLKFATPYATTVEAFALFGLKRFKAADHTIDKLVLEADEIGDSLSSANAAVARARLLLAQGVYEDAIAATDDRLLDTLSPGVCGEAAAVHALALACNGDLALADLAINRARSYSRAVEAETTALAAETVVALRRGNDDGVVNRLLEHVGRTCHIDAFVASYRAHPELLARSAVIRGFRSVVEAALVSGGDQHLAACAGLQLGQRTSPDNLPGSDLSTREFEVLTLVGAGLTNAAIAKQLYISEATVKVHVRHIFDKLGVRSRTQAALHPAARRTHYATSEMPSRSPNSDSRSELER